VFLIEPRLSRIMEPYLSSGFLGAKTFCLVRVRDSKLISVWPRQGLGGRLLTRSPTRQDDERGSGRVPRRLNTAGLLWLKCQGYGPTVVVNFVVAVSDK
jgi:hypothetical protein